MALEPWITRSRSGVWYVAEGGVGYCAECGTVGDMIEGLAATFGADALLPPLIEDERLVHEESDDDETDDGSQVPLTEPIRVKDLAATIRQHIQGAL